MAGALLGTLSRQHHRVSGVASAPGGSGANQDALSSSADRAIAKPPSDSDSAESVAAAIRKAAELAEHQREAEAAEQARQAAAQQAAAQQAAQKSLLEQQQHELEAQAAQQVEQQKQIEEAQRALAAQTAAEQQRHAQEMAQAAETARLRAERAAHTYQGPSSGEIVWRGEVHGTTLVTIDGGNSDAGQVVAGALPGVLVMVQPVDSRHVGVAATPAPSNAFRRMVLRIQGNGNMQEVIHWSIP